MAFMDDFLKRQMMAQTGGVPIPTSNPTPMPQGISQATPYPRDSEMSQVLAILSLLQNQVGQPRSDRQPVVAQPTGGEQFNTGEMVDYMNYDGDPNMGLLKGLFGGRAQPGRFDPLHVPITNDRATKRHRRGK